jgi:hypothetical protein
MKLGAGQEIQEPARMPRIQSSGRLDFLIRKPIKILCFRKVFGPEQGGGITGESFFIEKIRNH